MRTWLFEPESRALLVTLASLGLISITVLFRAWAVYGGWFFGDDFEFLSDVARGSTGPAWIFHRHNVHFMPVGFLLVLPVAKAGAFAWGAAATEIVILQALSSLCCWIMLRTLFGNRPRILVPLTFYLFSAISIPSIMWWAASLNMLTVQAPIFLAIVAHVTFLRNGQKRFAVAATVCLILALGCYVKALLLPVILGILALTYFTSGTPVQRVFQSIRRWWLAWILYGMVCLAYLFAYFRLGGSPAETGSVDYATLFQQQVIGSLGTTLVGGPWTWFPADLENGPRQLADPPELVQITCAIILILLVVYLAGRYRGALRPLWFVVPCIAATVAVLGVGRVAVFGTAISMEVRYWTDSLPYFALALGLMCMALRGSSNPLQVRQEPIIAKQIPRKLILALGSAYVVGALVSSISYTSTWHERFDARAFLETATADLEAQTSPVVLADESVPESVMQSLAFPNNLTSRMLAPLKSHFRTSAIANDIHVLNGYGQVMPGKASPDLVVPDNELMTCLETPRGVTPALVHLGSETFNYPFWVSVTYRSPVTMETVVSAAGNRYRAQLLEGLHTLSFRTTGSYDTIAFELPARTPLCIDSINIGKRIVAQ